MPETLVDKFYLSCFSPNGNYSETVLAIGDKMNSYDYDYKVKKPGIFQLWSSVNYEDLYLIPKSVQQPIQTIAAQNNKKNWNPESYRCYQNTQFTKMILAEKPEDTSIEDFLIPLANAGYGKKLIMTYCGTLCVKVNLNTHTQEEATELAKNIFTDIVKNWTNEVDLLHAMFGLHKDEKTNEICPRFLNKKISNIGMSFISYLDESFYKSRDKLLEAYKFEEAFVYKGDLIVPMYIENVILIKELKANCPPYTPENKFEEVYAAPGQCMYSSAVPKAFRRAMDYLKYFDRLEIVHKRHTNGRGWESAEMYMQIKPSTEGMNDIEVKIREGLKNCTEFVNETWMPLVFRCYLASNPNSKLTGEGIKEFLRHEGSGLDIFKDGRICYSVSNSESSNVNMKIGELVHDLMHNAEQAKILSEELAEIAKYLTKVVGGEEHLGDEYTLEEFYIKAMGDVVMNDPMSLIAVVNDLQAQNEEGGNDMRVNKYIKICADVAKESLT